MSSPCPFWSPQNRPRPHLVISGCLPDACCSARPVPELRKPDSRTSSSEFSEFLNEAPVLTLQGLSVWIPLLFPGSLLFPDLPEGCSRNR